MSVWSLRSPCAASLDLAAVREPKDTPPPRRRISRRTSEPCLDFACSSGIQIATQNFSSRERLPRNFTEHTVSGSPTDAGKRLISLLRRVELPEPSGPLPVSSDALGPAGETVRPAHELALDAASKLNQYERQRQHSREKRKALFEAVRAAHQRGVTKRAIAREFGITRLTIRRYLQAKEFPERAPRQRRSELDSFRGYLEKRWAKAATMRPNSAASCVSKAIADGEAE